MQNGGGDAEGHVRDDPEWFSRKLYSQGICAHHSHVTVTREALFQVAEPVRVVLHGYHLPSHPRQTAGKHPSSGPNLHYEIVIIDSSYLDYPSCDLLVLKEVLAQLAPPLALLIAPLLAFAVGAARRMPLASSRHPRSPTDFVIR